MNPFKQLDEYELRHFIEHLMEANRFEDTHRVLLQEDTLTIERYSSQKRPIKWLSKLFNSQPALQEFSSNAWYTAQLQTGENRNFIKDVRICWRLAETESIKLINNAVPASSIALETRYALIIASLNNLAGSIPYPLLSRSLQTNFLTIEQTLTYAEQIPDLTEKTLALAVIALNVDSPIHEEFLEQALAVLRSIPYESEQCEIIVKLAYMISEPFFLDQLINLTRNIPSWTYRIDTILKIYPLLTPPLIEELTAQMLDTAQKYNSQQYRQTILLAAIPFLEEAEKAETLKGILIEIESEKNEHTRHQSIKKFIEVASDEWLLAAKAIVDKFENNTNRATGELFFAPRLVANGQLNTVLQMFDRFSAVLNDENISAVLTEIIPFVQSSDIPSILMLILKNADENHRADLLVKFIPNLPEASVRTLIRSARWMRKPGPKAKVFAALAARLSVLFDNKLLEESVNKIAHKNVTETERREALTILAPYLSQHLLKQVMIAMQRIDDLHQQLLTIAANSSYLADDERLNILRKEVLQTKEIPDKERQSEVLADLIAKIAEMGYFEESFKLAVNIRSLKWRAKAFSKVYINTPQKHKVRIYNKIMQHWKPLYNKPDTAEFISYLAPHLSPDFVYEVINLVDDIKIESNTDILISIAEIAPMPILRERIMPLLDQLSPRYKTRSWDFISNILPSMKQMNSLMNNLPNSKRWNLLSTIAKRLAQLGEHEEAFQLAATNKNLVLKTFFDRIIPYLPHDLLLKVSEHIPIIESFQNSNNIYGVLAARFAEVGDEESAAAIIHKTYSPIQTSLAWAELARVSSQSLRLKGVEKSLSTLEKIRQVTKDEDNLKGEILSRLAEYLSFEQLQRAWLLSIEIDNSQARKKSLSLLAVKLSKFSQKEIYWFWAICLRRLSRRSRENFLVDLQSLAPLAYTLGGETAAYEIINAINQIGSWWGIK